MDTPETVTHLSLCCGYGGIDLGLHRAIPSLRTVAIAEIEAFACSNLVAKMEAVCGEQDEATLLDAAPIWTDLRTFPFGRYHGFVDLLSAGFPCQPFSCAGKGDADNDQRHLFPAIKRGIEQCCPAIVFLENVDAIMSIELKSAGWNDPAGTPVLLHVLRELERLGYWATAGVFSSGELGASHQRKRIFILAVADSHDCRGIENRFIAKLRASWAIESSGDCWTSDAGFTGKIRQANPMPPGPDQHWWEPSRTVADSGSSKQHRMAQPEERIEGVEVGQSSYGVGDATGSRCDRRENAGAGCCDAGEIGSRCEQSERAGVAVENTERSIEARREPGCGEAEGWKSCDQSGGSGSQARQTQPAMGRVPDAPTDRLDQPDVLTANCSRIDELRLIGNGVDPYVAEHAFRTLMSRYFNPEPLPPVQTEMFE